MSSGNRRRPRKRKLDNPPKPKPVKKRRRRNARNDKNDKNDENVNNDDKENEAPKSKNGKWTDQEKYDLIKTAHEMQWFTSGQIKGYKSNVDDIKRQLNATRTVRGIKDKLGVNTVCSFTISVTSFCFTSRLTAFNKEAARISAAMNNNKNKKFNDDGTETYKAAFMRSKVYKESQTEWYGYYQRELGDVTELATIPIQSS